MSSSEPAGAVAVAYPPAPPCAPGGSAPPPGPYLAESPGLQVPPPVPPPGYPTLTDAAGPEDTNPSAVKIETQYRNRLSDCFQVFCCLCQAITSCCGDQSSN